MNTREKIAIKFLELLEKSTITSGFLAVSLTVAVIYLTVIGREVPDVLAMALATIVGFFFGAKGQKEGLDAISKQKDAEVWTKIARKHE